MKTNIQELTKAVVILVFIASLLFTGLCISCDSCNKLKKENTELKQLNNSCFWKEYAEKADAFINAIYECDCDCIYDVAMEGDAYSEYIEYYERTHKKENK